MSAPELVDPELVDPGFVDPAYGSRSLADVLPAVAEALGYGGGESAVASDDSVLELPEASSYVVLLVDGLGAEQLSDHAHVAPYLGSLLMESLPGTAGVPSTTATSLTSLGTGLPPGAHGIVGYTSRVPGTGRLLNALQWDAAVDPVVWQPHDTQFTRLARRGAEVTVVSRPEFARSGLTAAAHRGARYVGAGDHLERVAAARAAAAVAGSVTYVYDGDLDWTGHRFGVSSPAWRHQLATIDADVEQLRDELPASARLVVVADHGMVDCAADDRTDIDRHPELRDGLYLLAGEARFRHLHVAAGALDDVVAAWREFFGPRAVVLTRDEAVGRGWFGPVDGPVRPRLGDVIVAATGGHGIFSSVDFSHETTLVGLHGSLTPAEMNIPILLA